MKIDRKKMQIMMANACVNPYELCSESNVTYQTYRRIIAGYKCKPATVGKIARALKCDVLDIIEDQE